MNLELKVTNAAKATKSNQACQYFRYSFNKYSFFTLQLPECHKSFFQSKNPDYFRLLINKNKHKL
jgi:hypothetical protein